MPFVTSQTALLDILAATIANVLDSGGSTHCTVHLAKDAFAPTPTSDPATFTEADFDGYTSKTVAAWEASYLVGGGNAETISTTLLHWVPTGSATSNVVNGYWIMGGNGDYLGGEAFAQPVPVTGPTSVLNLLPIFQQAPANFTAAVVP